MATARPTELIQAMGAGITMRKCAANHQQPPVRIPLVCAISETVPAGVGK